jgi:hypothetical protein
MLSCIYVGVRVLVVTACVPGCYFENRQEAQTYTLGKAYVFVKIRQNHSCDRGSCSFQEVVLRPYVNPVLLDVPSEASPAWLAGASAEEALDVVQHPGDPIFYADSEDFYDAPAGDSDVSV